MTDKSQYQCPACKGTDLTVRVTYEAALLQGGAWKTPRPASLPLNGEPSPFILHQESRIKCAQCEYVAKAAFFGMEPAK